MTRFLFLLAAASMAAWGQFYNLATPSDGSAVYFTTTLRLKNAYESPNGKVFAADERGVRLIAEREARLVPQNFPSCFLGQLYSFYGVEVSADARTMAARGRRVAVGQCHGAGSATLLRTPSGTRDVDGVLRISANGRWAIADTTTTVFSQMTGYFLDLTTGARTDLQLPVGPGGIQFLTASRTIANDGTALLWIGPTWYIARPGAALEPFPFGSALAMSANGSRVVYWANGIRFRSLATGEDRAVAGIGSNPSAIGLSDDGARAAFLNGQLQVVDLDSGSVRQVTNDPEGIFSAVLSGDGKTAYAVTEFNRLLKIAVDTGEVKEIVARTVDYPPPTPVPYAGLFTTIGGFGFVEQSFTASAPLPLSLGGVSVRIGGRLVPIARVTPREINFLVPWDISGAALPFVVETPPTNTPFAPPQPTLTISNGPGTGALYRQDWTPISDLTVHTGEVIHVFAVGLGATAPEVPVGSAAPSGEPFARLASPMTCSNATVLYAGLQPGTVARVYQVDMQIGGKTGYQQFACTLGSGDPFPFLTLNVVP